MVIDLRTEDIKSVSGGTEIQCLDPNKPCYRGDKILYSSIILGSTASITRSYASRYRTSFRVGPVAKSTTGSWDNLYGRRLCCIVAW